jgi:hypothetical protein
VGGCLRLWIPDEPRFNDALVSRLANSIAQNGPEINRSVRI